MRIRTKAFLTYLWYAVVLYSAISCTVFRFRHPKLTNTELVLTFFYALLWREPSQ